MRGAELKAFVSDFAANPVSVGQLLEESTISINLESFPGFRPPPVLHHRYSEVTLARDFLADHRWQAKIDGALLLLDSTATLVLEFHQTQWLSVYGIKRFLFRRYGWRFEVVDESVDSTGLFRTVLAAKRLVIRDKVDGSWTFGILTTGSKVDSVINFCKSVRELGGDQHQIIISGPINDAYAQFDVEYVVPKDLKENLAEISRKKNEIVRNARHDNICLLHDRFVLESNFFSGFDRYGYDFDYLTIQQFHRSGKVYPSYCAILEPRDSVWGPVYHVLDEKEVWSGAYLNGGLTIAKKDVLTAIPFNDLIFHNQAEDVELAKSMKQQSLLCRINRFSSAITDVPDFLTEPFESALVEPHTEANQKAAFEYSGLFGAIARGSYAAYDLRRSGASFITISKRGAKKIFSSLRRRMLRTSNQTQKRPVPSKEEREKVRPPLFQGVNILMYASDSGGVMNATTSLARHLMSQGVPVCIVDIGSHESWNDPRTRLAEDLKVVLSAQPRYPTNIWAQGFPWYLELSEQFPTYFENRWNIGFTFWELPHVPERFSASVNVMDSILVMSEFVKQAILDVATVPVEQIDWPNSLIQSADSMDFRAKYDLPDLECIALVEAEFTSGMDRKNCEASIQAIIRSRQYGSSTTPVLRVKFEKDRYDKSLEDRYHEYLAYLKRTYPELIILDLPSMDYESALEIKASCNIYVSLSKSEGLGLGAFEAHEMGKDTVITGWSGTTELKKLAESESVHFVNFELVPVFPNEFPWVTPGEQNFQRWAEADVEHAAKIIHEIAAG